MAPQGQITANGWLLFDNSKMSKSKGNVVRTETILDAFGQHYRNELVRLGQPEPTPRDADLFATDVLRYFLLREIPFGQDGTFSFDALITRYNADLANGYGNLVSRTLTLDRHRPPPDCVIEATASKPTPSSVYQCLNCQETHRWHPYASACRVLLSAYRGANCWHWSHKAARSSIADVRTPAGELASPSAIATIASAIASVDRLMTSRFTGPGPLAETDCYSRS